MFPRAHTLNVFVDESASARVDVSGLDLWALEVHGGTRSLVPNSALASIPVVEHDHATIDTFWPASRNELCACVEPMYSEAPIISFAPRSGIWRRSFVLDARGPGSPLPLADVHFLPKQLVSLTLTRQHVNAFVRVPLVLDALRELFLDLGSADGYSWPPDAGVDALEARLRCPKLTRFVVFVRGHSVTVCPERLERLARLIGIEAKPGGPTLTLAGCTFSPAPRGEALNEVFSFIDIVPSSDAHVPDYYTTCRYEGQPAWDTIRDRVRNGPLY